MPKAEFQKIFFSFFSFNSSELEFLQQAGIIFVIGEKNETTTKNFFKENSSFVIALKKEQLLLVLVGRWRSWGSGVSIPAGKSQKC